MVTGYERQVSKALAEIERLNLELVGAINHRRRTRRLIAQLRDLEVQVEIQRRHRQDTRLMMVCTGAPSTSRGTKSFRPVPNPGEL